MIFGKQIKTAKDGIVAANAIASIALIIAFTALFIAIGTDMSNG